MKDDFGPKVLRGLETKLSIWMLDIGIAQVGAARLRRAKQLAVLSVAV